MEPDSWQPNQNPDRPRVAIRFNEGGTFFSADDFVMDRNMDAVIDLIAEREARERELDLERSYRERGARKLKLAVRELSPRSSEHNPEWECAICLEELGGTLASKLTNCGHMFHSDCLNKWSTLMDYKDQEVGERRRI